MVAIESGDSAQKNCETTEGRKEVPLMTQPPARRTKPGGLVARRLELFDSPMHGERKGYVHRPQDSFHPSSLPPADETRPKSLSPAEEKRPSSLPLAEETRHTSLPPAEETRDEETREYSDRFTQRDQADARVVSQSSPNAGPPAPKVPKNYAGSALIEGGVNHYTKGEYDKALKAFVAALKTQRVSAPGDDDICVALTLGNLGAVYLQQGNFVEAERVLQESLEIKKSLAPNMLMADTLNNLGNCANMRGDYINSCLYYEEALEEIRSKNGPRVDEINALFNIGRLEIQREHWTKAMIALSDACRMAKEHYGSNSELVAQPLDLMGFVQLSTGKLDAAMVSFTGALAIYRRIYGPMHLEVANSLYNVGMVREAKGDLADAWEAFTTARDLYARLGTEHDHPGYKTVRKNIAQVEREVAKQNQKRLVTKHKKSIVGKPL